MSDRKTMLVGKAPLTVIRHTNGTRSNVSAGRPVPESIAPDDAQRLLDEDFLEEVELLEVDGVDVVQEEIVPEDDGLGGGDDEPTSYTDEELDEILAKSEGDLLDEVGDDAVLAAALLARETGDGGKSRKGVSAGLQDVLDAAEDDGGAQS